MDCSSNHVFRVKRGRMLGGILEEGDVREYGLADGLHGSGRCQTAPICGGRSLGRIWVSMNRGFSVVIPRGSSGLRSGHRPVQTISADGEPIEHAR